MTLGRGPGLPSCQISRHFDVKVRMVRQPDVSVARGRDEAGDHVNRKELRCGQVGVVVGGGADQPGAHGGGGNRRVVPRHSIDMKEWIGRLGGRCSVSRGEGFVLWQVPEPVDLLKRAGGSLRSLAKLLGPGQELEEIPRTVQKVVG